MRVLVADKLADEGLELLKSSGVDFSVKVGLKEEELEAEVGAYDALIVRSGAKVTKKVLANPGIGDTVKPKLRPAPNGQDLIAAGEIDIGLYNVSEIPRAKGVVLAGPVPAAVQVYIVYDAPVPVSNTAPEPALALVRYLGRESTRAIWIKGGLEPAGE